MSRFHCETSEIKEQTHKSPLQKVPTSPLFNYFKLLLLLLLLLLHSHFSVFLNLHKTNLYNCLRKNPTNTLIYVNTTLFTLSLLHVAALEEPFSGNTETFHDQGQQNTRPDVNIWKPKHFTCTLY
jgi:hypothetical protein